MNNFYKHTLKCAIVSSKQTLSLGKLTVDAFWVIKSFGKLVEYVEPNKNAYDGAKGNSFCIWQINFVI